MNGLVHAHDPSCTLDASELMHSTVFTFLQWKPVGGMDSITAREVELIHHFPPPQLSVPKYPHPHAPLRLPSGNSISTYTLCIFKSQNLSSVSSRVRTRFAYI